jgi:hypothetical protein
MEKPLLRSKEVIDSFYELSYLNYDTQGKVFEWYRTREEVDRRAKGLSDPSPVIVTCYIHRFQGTEAE